MSLLKIEGLKGFYECIVCHLKTGKKSKCGGCGSTHFCETYVPVT